MKFKNTILILTLVLVSIAILNGVLAANDDLDINLQYNPHPAFPGSYANLTFTIENTGAENLRDVLFDLKVSDPLSLLSNSKQTIDSIAPGETKIINYNLYIDGSADEGTEQITLKYYINGENYNPDFDIKIAPRETYLRINDIKTDPSEIEPGKSANLAIYLENPASSDIKDITIKLNPTNLPFSLNGVSEKHITSLNKRSTLTLNFNISAAADAEIKTYQILLLLTYYDSYGNFYQRQDSAYVKVYSKPEVDLVLDNNALIIGKASKVSFKILNKGLSGIKFSELKILENQGYDINGKTSEYVGNIDSDDYTTVEFELVPKKQDLSVNLILNYRDLDNNYFTSQVNLDVKAYTIREAQKNNLLPGFPVALIVILVIIILIIVWAVLRKKKKKKLAA